MLIYDPSKFLNLSSFADAALLEYKSRYSLLLEAGSRFDTLLQILLRESTLPYQSLKWRQKLDGSFRAKAARPDPSNPMRPKYECPSEQIEDQLGFRIVTYLRRDVQNISSLIVREFAVISTEDKAMHLLATKRFGYQSVHHVMKLRSDRASMLENRRFSNIRFELQIRTILQDAWAEIEHNVGYKPQYEKPDVTLERRFLSLAGVLEMVDAEFERIKDDAATSRAQVHKDFESDAEDVKITANSLELLISTRLGDGDLDKDVLITTADVVNAFGYPSIASLNSVIDKHQQSRAFKRLAIEYPDPVMRLYGILALEHGADNLRRLVAPSGVQPCSWDSFFSFVESAGSSP